MDMASLPPINMTTDESKIEEKKQPAYKNLAKWMLVFSMVMLIVPLYLVNTTLTEQIMQADVNITEMQALINDPESEPEINQLNAQLLQLRNEYASLNNIHQQLTAQNIDWVRVIYAIGNHDAAYIQLDEVEQLENGIQIRGLARDEASVIVYERQLEAVNLFQSVDIQTMEQEKSDEPSLYPIRFHMRLIILEVE